MEATYSLMSSAAVPRLVFQRVEKLFCCMDTNKDGVVDEQEFREYGRSNQALVMSMTSLP